MTLFASKQHPYYPAPSFAANSLHLLSIPTLFLIRLDAALLYRLPISIPFKLPVRLLKQMHCHRKGSRGLLSKKHLLMSFWVLQPGLQLGSLGLGKA